ncbi:MAG: excinuclease ABC subunit B [Candidatus Levybacteria bacterium RIFCSPHIGHO2_02_FULL_40_18]|nr:MAG: excinuclease ABC subunit B [Candidatus Levybacteria bacterium RIFCSPHIGHO2_01_FULL_40_58]OGH27301.1 MAG: excinuclease ABC subunit B [Candidatus Levybacteria bacterium RIFCSPHIGHO2_02_FULL_40_18]OGH30932.1 MAG: excinuclease ABC subunit B [Candidatus Levybacteria bacterium RIFCSPHIGHO2_12_FULL_40_31]OGH40943.1 MAG: excinuclease ABC subunit B [Candidatus Levybacteria bacterium RIFCSPLOWO2_01_FULL_40_64]OGH48980.1 MAG: excinuclease ABC subunit B [Candidatus Levybacteria bacterium RIFCSPLOWO
MKFELVSKFKPTGDQPEAIEKLTDFLRKGEKNAVLLGVTGSGKTFTISNVIQNLNIPTLVMTHNKTLAAQLYQEFRDFFPKNAVSYFVSYYDYYQPEAYMPTTDTYIAKETEINEEIDKLRLAATTNILTRQDTIVVASVSAIYNLGSPKEYGKFAMELAQGVKLSRGALLDRLLDLQYARNDYAFKRSTFRVRGDAIEVYPSYEEQIVRIALTGDTIDKIQLIDPLNGNIIEEKKWTMIYPAKHYITDRSSYENVFEQIRRDLKVRVKELKDMNKLLEAERLTKRTEYDIKMIREIGYVNGIENYSRYFDGRKPGEPPFTLLDYFEESGKPWLLLIDESHMTNPQIRGMFHGDRSRKELLVEYGFRLPSAFDNRPLTFDEFRARVHQTVFMSATPSEWELENSGKNNVAEQLVRPTGIPDPQVQIRQTEGQIDSLISEIRTVVAKKERVLVTTLTKRMAEDLSFYLQEKGIKVNYLHSEIDTLARQDILDELREGKYDVIVGINLLREGLDLPEVSLVVIMDADKEGFLRSKTSLIQIMGRAARRVDSKVILYADDETGSMKSAIHEVERRRKRQLAYNKKHGITPRSIEKEIRAKLIRKEETIEDIKPLLEKEVLLPDERDKVIKRLRKEMIEAAKLLDFETAALLRDKIRYLKSGL